MAGKKFVLELTHDEVLALARAMYHELYHCMANMEGENVTTACRLLAITERLPDENWFRASQHVYREHNL